MEELVNHLITCWKQKIISPHTLELRISDKCNLNCTFCPGRDKEMDIKKSLSLKKWKDVIRQASNLGVKQCIFFSDLEPFMYKDALELISEIKKQKLFGKTATNGTLLTKKVCEELIKVGWDEISVSLEGPDAETNDPIRGKGVFKLVNKNLLELKKNKKKIGSIKPRILFHTVLTNMVYKKLDKMILLAHDLDIDGINFHPLNLWNKEAKKLELSDEQYKNVSTDIVKIKRFGDELGVKTNIESFARREWEKESIRGRKKNTQDLKKFNLPSFLRVACYLPWYFISVHEDGRVNPCHSLHKSEENIKSKTLKNIWNGYYFDSMRKKIKEEKYPKECYTNCCMMQSMTHLKLKEIVSSILTKNDYKKI